MKFEATEQQIKEIAVKAITYSKPLLILVWTDPELADQISTWGEDERQPWSFALIHEEFITR
jgi:hypothetical protein